MDVVYLEVIFIFILGLVIGSFLGSVVYRVKNKISLRVKRSFCVMCKTTLKVVDLIPLVGYFAQKGKCRFCKEPVS